jgi:hypothetical protein
VIGTPVEIVQIPNTSATETVKSPACIPSFSRISRLSRTFPFIFFFFMQTRYLRISSPLLRTIARSTSTQLKPRFYLQPKVYQRQYTMAQAMHGHSAACCSIPPIVSKGYEPKGKYETIGGLKTCKCSSIPAHFLWICPPAPCSPSIANVLDA